MWRGIATGLLALNLFLLAWGQGWLDRVIGPASGNSPGEPERLSLQVEPQAVTVVPVRAPEPDISRIAQASSLAAARGESPRAPAPAPAAAPAPPPPPVMATARPTPAAVPTAPASAPAAAPALPAASPDAPKAAIGAAPANVAAATPVANAVGTVCLAGGPFTELERRALMRESGENGVPAERWDLRVMPMPEQWVVYIGPLKDRPSLQRKADELQRIGVSAREVSGSQDFQPGLALARGDSQAEVMAAMESLKPRGVRTARVLDLGTGKPRFMLRLNNAPAGLLAQLQTVNIPVAVIENRRIGTCAP